MAKQTIYNAGIYVRLSQEDMRAGESLSIENQKLILTKYVKEQGWNPVTSTFSKAAVCGDNRYVQPFFVYPICSSNCKNYPSNCPRATQFHKMLHENVARDPGTKISPAVKMG